MRAIRGNEISMIFQEPMTSLNPVLTIGRQIAETLMLHQGLSKQPGARARHRDASISSAFRSPPGGSAISTPAFRRHAPARHDRHGARLQPRLLIADEPTTALDVTIQAQILD